MKRTLLAAAAVAAIALPAAAQEARGMGAALTMLELEVVRAFDKYDIQGDVMGLSLNQIVEIRRVLDESSNGAGPTATRQGIEAAINRS